MSSTAGAVDTRTGQTTELIVRLRAAIWLTVLALMGFLALLLTWRRIVGALSEPPSGFGLIVAAAALLLAAASLRRMAPWESGNPHAFSLPGIAAFLLLAA